MFENCSQVILKVTKDCNLRCTYCYVKNKDHYKGQNMSFDMFKKLIQRIIRDHRRSVNPPDRIEIIFHGGEPTLLEKSELQRFINYARKEIPTITFGMQTNTTNLNDEWIALLIKNNISLGISLDGISTRENELRKQGYSFNKTLRLFRKYNLAPGVLSIISTKNYKKFPKTLKNIIQHTSTIKPNAIRANYVEDLSVPQLSPYEVSGKNLYTFIYKPLLEKALRTKTPPIEANLRFILDKYAESILSDQPLSKTCSNCYTKFCRTGSAVIEVEPTGEVNSCGRWDVIRDISTVGHIEKPDPWGLHSLHVALQLQLLKIKDIRHKQCDFCPAAMICDYGCIAFSFIKYNGKVQIRQEISCDLFIPLQKMLFANRYQVILISAKQKKLPIQKTKKHYIISLPQNYSLKEINSDKNIKIISNKLYLPKQNTERPINV